MFSMFRKSKTVMIHSLIAANTTVEGNIRFSSGMQIDGKILGDVIAEDGESPLVIGPKAEIHGCVKAGSVLCEGKIFGPVDVSGLASVRKTGKVIGSVAYGSIHIEEGGQILGNLEAKAPSAPQAAEDLPKEPIVQP